MNILVIGNGFDLAHELPTKYTDFLEFIYEYNIYKEDIEDLDKEEQERYIWGGQDIKELERDFCLFFQELRSQSENNYNELGNLISENVWIKYFKGLQVRETLEEKVRDGWIDFEVEISRIIQNYDKVIKNILRELENGKDVTLDIYQRNLQIIKKILNGEVYNLVQGINDIDSKEIIEQEIKKFIDGKTKPLVCMNKLIRCLEIYLDCYINQLTTDIRSPDIEKLEIDKILSFNYTDTYARIYDVADSSNIEYDYIHGKANVNNTLETNNMVLGIDEYLPKKRRNKDVEFIAFKKYYQRIHKKTGCKYKDWADQIREDWNNETEAGKAEIRKYISKGKLENPKIHKLYIFGHSLDVTDKDILRDLILNDNVHTTIFYHNREVMGQQIANLVKVIGQNQLIKRTGGSTKTIEFRQQQDMVEMNS